MRTTATSRFVAGLTLAATLAVAGCTTTSSPSASGSGGTGRTGGSGADLPIAHPNLQLASAIEPFDACDDLLAYVKQNALDRVGPYGLDGDGAWSSGGIIEEDAIPPNAGRVPTGVPTTIAPTTVPATAPASAPPAPSTEGGAKRTGDGETTSSSSNDASSSRTADRNEPADQAPGSPEFSETNVQEKGVDEPDTIKTDGTRILSISGNRLYQVDVTGGAPRLAGSIALPGNGGTQLLLSGNHLLAIAPDSSDAVDSAGSKRSPASGPDTPTVTTLLSIIDVADAAHMKVLHSVRIDGELLSARMVDGRARVVTSSDPEPLPFVYPSSSTASAEAAAEAANRRIIEESTIEDWLPSIRIGETVTPTVQPLLECSNVSHPKTFSGFGTVAITSVDVTADEIDPTDTVGVMADGQTVYASKESLYVATPGYVEPTVRRTTHPATTTPPGSTPGTAPGTTRPTTTTTARPFDGPSTSIHKFSIAAAGPAVYRASGEVAGTLLSQYSMSDEAGTLRVATTATACPGCGGTETYVKVLQEVDGELKEVGSIGDMGHGEQVKAVRFVGAQGYVVTFRQTDPLYTLDLTEPTAPKVVGELKLLGYSAYLHPVGDRMLIGVGQDATETGRALGTKVALYDMADLANPRELQQYVLWNSTSEVEQEVHSFLWWEQTKLAVLPVDRAYVGYIGGDCSPGGVCSPQQYIPPFTGAIGLTVDRDGIREVGRIVNPGARVPTGGRCGVVGPCVPDTSPCPPDAMCTTSEGSGGGTGEAIDCTAKPCTEPPNVAPIPVSTVPVPTTAPCPPDADCLPVPTRPVPPCYVDDVTGAPLPSNGSSYCPNPQHVSLGAPITRTLVIGDALYSFSDNGIKRSDLATLHEQSWLPFA